MHKRYLFLVLMLIGLTNTPATALPPPVADFVANETDICLGETIAFTDLSENTPESWLWEFGDGNTSTDQHPDYLYPYAGTFTVTLNATNAAGSNEKEIKAYITVTDCAGNPDFSANITCYIGKPLTVQFTGFCPHPEFKNDWDWGDGNTTDDIQSPEHTYYDYGVYSVNHTCDAAGYDPVTETKTDYIVVGVEGTVCEGDCETCRATESGGDEDPNYLIIGATLGMVIGTFILGRTREE